MGWVGRDDDVHMAVYKADLSRQTWGSSLYATGGALQPKKCSVTIHALEPDGKGDWKYFDHTNQTSEDGLEIDPDEITEIGPFYAPQGENEPAQITQLSTSQAVENLGLFTRPEWKA